MEVKSPRFFSAPDEFHAWLDENHATAPECWVGFRRKASGLPSMTWPQSVDEALCYGWIDGIRKSIDADRYAIRFTPRKPTSNWSAVNIARVAALTHEGRLQPAGAATFARRRDDRSAIYSYEQRRNAALDTESDKAFRANASAWKFFAAQSAAYRRTASWWVISAKRPETRRSRLQSLIRDSEAGRKIT